jgi:O-antigen ligase
MTSIAYAALWLFVFALPFEGSVRVNNTAILSQASGVLAMGLTVFAVLSSARLRRLRPLHFAALLFVVVAGIELLIFHSGDRPPAKFYTYIQLLLMVWMVWELAPTRARVLNLLFAYVLGGYVASLQTVLVFHSTGGGLRRFAAGGVDPNDLAMTMALGVPMAWYLSNTYGKPLVRWICRLYLPAAVLAIGLTGSRGGLLTSIVALTIVPLSMTRLSAGRLSITIAMLFLSGGLAVAYVPDKIVERLATTSTEVEDFSLGGRFKLWKAGIRALPEHPLLGFGTSGFIRAIYPQLGPAALVAHNSFVSVLVEQGLIGLILFLSMFGFAFLAVRRLPLLERRFGLVLIATLVVAMLPLTWEHRKPVWFILAALVGLAEAFKAAPAGRLGGQVRSAPPLARAPGPLRPVGPAARPREAGA